MDSECCLGHLVGPLKIGESGRFRLVSSSEFLRRVVQKNSNKKGRRDAEGVKSDSSKRLLLC